MQDRLVEAETRETQSREEGERAKAELFQVRTQAHNYILGHGPVQQAVDAR